MSDQELKLQITQGSWQKFHARKGNSKFQSIAKNVLSRDNCTCHYCGFRSEKYQEIVNLDGNYLNNKTANMITACRLCTQCLFIDAFDMDEHFGGYIIYLPEISQANLNNLSRVIFHVLGKDSPYKNHLQAVYLSLKDRTEMVEKTFGPGTSNPATFAQSLLDCGVPDQHINQSLLSPLRVLPARKTFKPLVEYWATQVFNRFPL